jgi:hypothetical protein
LDVTENVFVQGEQVTANGDNVTIGQEAPGTLRFWKAAPATGDLLFGESDTPVTPQYPATFNATLPELGFSAVAIPTVRAEFNATLPGMSFEGEAEYLSRTQRPTVGKAASEWQVADHTSAVTSDQFQATDAMQRSAPSWWQDADAAPSDTRSVFQNAQHTQREVSTQHQDAMRVPCQQRQSRFQDASRTPLWRSARHQDATARRTSRASRHQDADHRQRISRRARHQAAQGLGRWFGWQNGTALHRLRSWRSGEQDAMRPPPGMWKPLPPEPPKPFWTTDLLFAKPWDNSANLLFGWTGEREAVVVPVRSVYMVVNEVSLRRVSNNLQLPPLSFSLKIDADSWTWGFNASFPLYVLADLEPNVAGDPVELEATINGNPYRVLVESISRDRSFAEGSISVSGRGKSAYLDSPYAVSRSFSNAQDRTAAQLMGDVLTVNGSSFGWDVDWRITDWLVPSGAWAHQGSFISALKTIAEAAGSYLQPHPTLQTIRVLPRYATAPWNWNSVTPDIELPSALTTREGIEWVEKARYNAVYVTGVTNGVIGQVRRTGTAGDIIAPMVVDPLLTEAAAARQRGVAILGDTGRIANVSLRVPVLPETGIIEPGTFISYVDGGTTRRGVVRSTSVDVGYPEVFQSLGVETHA